MFIVHAGLAAPGHVRCLLPHPLSPRYLVPPMALAAVTPVLRIFDLDTAYAFYVDFLGFTVDWEHRHEPDFPVYLQVSCEACVLHLTEHHGDAAPGAAIRIASSDLDALHAELAAKNYRYARPHIEDKPWGTREMVVWDPFHNRLTFAETTET